MNNSEQLTPSNQTGRLMFKFDDDEPQEFAEIHDYGSFKIELQQPKDLQHAGSCSIEFISNTGKKFKLFIEECH